AAAALAAMLEATHLTAQFVGIQRNHLFRTRLGEGRLAARQAVFPTPEVPIRQPDGPAEALIWPAHLLLQLNENRHHHFGHLRLFFGQAPPTPDGSAPSAPGLGASPAAPGSGVGALSSPDRSAAAGVPVRDCPAFRPSPPRPGAPTCNRFCGRPA